LFFHLFSAQKVFLVETIVKLGFHDVGRTVVDFASGLRYIIPMTDTTIPTPEARPMLATLSEADRSWLESFQIEYEEQLTYLREH